MSKIIKQLLSLALLITTNVCNISAYAQNNQNTQDFYTIWLPGLHGGRAENNSLLIGSHYKIYDVIKPASQADLGQDECIRHFESQLSADPDFQQSKKIIFIGSSQGAATLLNKIALMPHEEQEAKIAALILEAPLADGNEAIMQSALKKPGLGYFPLVRFWSPWIGKAYHRHYKPYGMQALTSAKYISAKIPVIILHNKIDARISINSARKLVCEFLKARQNRALEKQSSLQKKIKPNIISDDYATAKPRLIQYPKRSNHINNVYYLETDIHAKYGDSHTDFLREDTQSSAAFHAICKKIGLPYDAKQSDEFNDEELCLFQPSVDQLEKEIQKDTWFSSYARNTIDGLILITLAAALYVLIKKLYSNNNKPL